MLNFKDVKEKKTIKTVVVVKFIALKVKLQIMFFDFHKTCNVGKENLISPIL